MREFQFNINGTLEATTLPGDIEAPGGKIAKAWENFLQVLDAEGCRVKSATFKHPEKSIALKTLVPAIA